ncbi:phosphatidate cytidylyltransferase [Herbaspirillum sp. RV1423]|uniref:phosphatidate cytidylyltransferase n=1 Tax=Herbaspirillum sp. RV1423 TaxID=1443993 RepID=UPI0004B98BAA|nr:phosphatidate cytidylyltransferase [Herbaspirillum sp. RV1423]
MLKTRVITALVLLAILLPVLFLNNFFAFAVVTLAFFAAGVWEGLRLFRLSRPELWAGFWSVGYAIVVFVSGLPSVRGLFAVCVALWAIRFVPALKLGLPPLDTAANRLLSITYTLALLGCFIAIVSLFQHSPLYLLSVMAIVWLADIGAYFAGKGFGRHKLAPSISPGKSWEGAVGGWLVVLVAAAAVVMYLDGDTFPGRLYGRFGWPGFIVVMSLLVATSVVGDLFESQLKRRASVKDSSSLLPGHGGVLDRIDALIPVLPLAALIDLWL